MNKYVLALACIAIVPALTAAQCNADYCSSVCIRRQWRTGRCYHNNCRCEGRCDCADEEANQAGSLFSHVPYASLFVSHLQKLFTKSNFETCIDSSAYGLHIISINAVIINTGFD